MKNIVKIFKRDLKSIVKNPIALIIVAGVCVIPALYAWVNIKACWDPYGNTSTIPIAVVNSDKGAEVLGEQLNVGQEIIEELKNNKNIGWRFVSKENADSGVIDGTYFASIEIPENFSEDLVSITTDRSKKAEIIYKLDTKANPVAGKIAGVAEETLVDEITTNFIETVNEKAFEKIDGYEDKIDKNKIDIIKLKKLIITTSKEIDSIINILDGVNSNSENLNNYLKEVKSTLPLLTSGMSTGESIIQNAENLIKTTTDSFTNSISILSQNLSQSKINVDKIIAILDNLKNNDNTVEINSQLGNAKNAINLTNNSVTSNIKYLEAVNKEKPNETISQSISDLKVLQNDIINQESSLESIWDGYSSGNKENEEVINKLKDNLKHISSNIENLQNSFESGTAPILNDINNNLINATKKAYELLNDSQKSVSGITNLLNTAEQGSGLASTVSGNLLDELKYYRDDIKALGEQLSRVNDEDLKSILAILQSNPDLISNFIADPFNIKEVQVYSVPNYGSAMAPIYSVLAIWVGGLILTSILKTEAPKIDWGNEPNIREKYFGKMFTFVLLAAIQGLIIAVGNIFLLNVYSVSPILMVIFSVLSAITFSIIIFTNVSLLGNVGKAINIVFMIVQLAGCGGSYPVQVDPLIFRIIQPFFPFTYAVGGFREAIAGPLISSVILDISILLLFSILYVILGFIFKPRLKSVVKKFEKKFHESGIGE
ncbi:YhgE/Pip domain-containing protein [Clostridium tertium]|jgi:putative membrane protein|uniref:YhgE/Pip domain-containing protein n=1 Tax=Clostridium tertium TaxID=1559 RepID=UPI00232F8305|nr:YhgE/Pip domain-containing protein [Clostridium tertium]MDB1922751.1 YhgE/Pip domain-containing protein [Clostridium tertium]MDB1925816.1 YhgE/Pip domain-containing protein [Clostridium tertium]MDB1929107.1 YhgE/Pip domain-containing protein [Clostridium tertium]